MSDALLVAPVLVPLLTCAACLLAWRRQFVQRALAVLGAAALLGCGVALLWRIEGGGPAATQIGGWPAPFGITLVADMFSAIMVVLAGVVGLSAAIYSLGDIGRRRQSLGYFPLFHVLLMGVCGAFLTGDIFNLFVWFEVMLMASFVLMALGNRRAQLEAAIKYVTLNLLSSALFLAAVGILYGQVGTLNMADLAGQLRHVRQPGVANAVSGLFLVAFGIKAAAFPLFFWLPASYPAPPVAVSALFAGLLTKVGVYALIRVFSVVFVHDVGLTHGLILAISVPTMVCGVLGAYAQGEFRRILSFHIVSQIGYMILGLGLFTPLALAGAVFYIAHHIIVKTNLFLISGVVHRLRGTFALAQLGGLYRARPALGLLFLIPALSLAGLPPLSGFFAKLVLIKAGLEARQYAVVAAALAVGLLTLLSMVKIWREAFWRPAPPGAPDDRPLRPSQRRLLLGPAVALAALTVAIGLAPGLLMELSMKAAEQLINPSDYIRAVLEAGR